MPKSPFRLDPRPAEIPPSDYGQAIVRLFIVGLVLTGAVVSGVTQRGNLDWYAAELAFPALYFGFSGIVCYLLRMESGKGRVGNWPITTSQIRNICLVTDIGAIAAFTAVSDELGLLILPVYLSYVIGNGFRFGMRYFFAAFGLAMAGFTVSLGLNEFLRGQPWMVASYYISLTFVPAYALFLLLRYRAVLRALHETTDELDALVATLGHEFRAPLQIIANLTDRNAPKNSRQIRSDRTDSVTEVETRLSLVHLCCDRMIGVVNRIVADARYIKGVTKDGTIGATNLYASVAEAVTICRVKAARKGMNLAWTIDSGCPPWVKSDKSLIQEVLINLLDNAAKYSEAPVVRLTVEISELDGESAVTFLIDEEGGSGRAKRQGLSSENGNVQRSDLDFSAGLGLEITRRQVKRLGGKIEFGVSRLGGVASKVMVPLQTTEAPAADFYPWIPVTVEATAMRAFSDLSIFAECGLLIVGVYEVGSSVPAAGSDLLFFTTDILQSDWAPPAVQDHLREPVKIFVATDSGLFDSASANYRILADVLCDLKKASSFVKEEKGASADSISTSNGRRILIVEDSDLLNQQISTAFRDAGATVYQAYSVPEAKGLVGAVALDLIVSDHEVAGMGAEVFLEAAFKTHSEPVPVVYLTGDTSEALREQLLSAGASGVLHKPMASNTLVNEVFRLVPERDSCLQRSASADVLELRRRHIEDQFGSGLSYSELKITANRFRTELLRDLNDIALFAFRGERASAVQRLHMTKGLILSMAFEGMWDATKIYAESLVQDGLAPADSARALVEAEYRETRLFRSAITGR